MAILYSFNFVGRSLAATATALLLAATAQAQAPAWGGAAFGSSGTAAGAGMARATAIDASGNVFVTGTFTGTIAFGTTTLTDRGDGDVFLAKYVPSTNTWAWATSAGGTSNDEGTSLAVVGNAVYVAGNFSNSTADTYAVRFGGTGNTAGTTTVRGATAAAGSDIFLAKYVDGGSSATLAWTQVAGGTTADYSSGLAASGTNIYLAASIQNNTTDTNGVLFGGNGSALGTTTVRGATASTTLDLCLAKYTDNGNSATLAWTQVGGGTNQDFAGSVAVSGTAVYVTGTIWNSQANANGVLFGGNGNTAGITVVRGASPTAGPDLLLAKYTDNGSTATLGWTQVGGGESFDVAGGVATAGTSVYLTGTIRNNAANASGVLFGGNGTAAGAVAVRGVAATNSADLVLAKYTDNGRSAALGWVQVGGGSDQDSGQGVTVRGTSVYVTGALANNTANASGVLFGSNGSAPGTVSAAGTSALITNDLLLAKYTDNGSSAAVAWVQVGGGSDNDYGSSLALSGQQVFVAGTATAPGTFGPAAIPGVAGTTGATLAYLTDATLTPLPTRIAGAGSVLSLYPSPSSGRATLTGAAPGQAVLVVNAVGQVVATGTADVAGMASLQGLATGLYIVRAGEAMARLVVK